MGLQQRDLFGEDLPIQRRLPNAKALGLLEEKKALHSSYNGSEVFFLGLEEYMPTSSYVAKIEIHSKSKGSRMLRLYFDMLSEKSINFQSFSFGTNTHREQRSSTNYSLDSKQIQEILQEIVKGNFIKTQDVKKRIKTSVGSLLAYTKTCLLCHAPKSSDGYNCISCGEYNPEGLGEYEAPPKHDIEALADEHAHAYAQKAIRVVKGLNFLPNASDFKGGVYYFSNIYLNGSKRTRIKVEKQGSRLVIYTNPRNWTRTFVGEKRKFGQIYAAMGEIIRDAELAES